MANRKQPAQAEEQTKKSVKLEKELRKREKCLQDKLLEAQERQVKVLERFIKADTRLRKRTARVERLEERLESVHQQQAELANPRQSSETDVSEGAVSEGAALPDTPVESSSSAPVPEGEPFERVREARAAAEAAEENARRASERAAEISSRQEQPDSPGSGLHPEQERRETQFEMDPASAAVQEANYIPDEAEESGREIGEPRELEQPVQQEHTESSESSSIQGETEQVENHSEPGGIEEWGVERQLTTPLKEEKHANQVNQGPSAAERARVEEIEEDEEVVAAVAAMMIADVAAASAAKAEAIAEACSARTREARHDALQADRVLEEVRAAIASGAFSGEDANRYLQSVEREVTRAQALLADAEAAEEQARNVAMNAEAEAEVAEGMALAASGHAETALEEHPVSTQPLVNDDEGRVQDAFSIEKEAREDDGDELDDTEEMPAITERERG